MQCRYCGRDDKSGVCPICERKMEKELKEYRKMIKKMRRDKNEHRTDSR